MKIRASWAAVASHELALFRFVLDRHEAVDAHDEARGEGSRAELAEGLERVEARELERGDHEQRPVPHRDIDELCGLEDVEAECCSGASLRPEPKLARSAGFPSGRERDSQEWTPTSLRGPGCGVRAALKPNSGTEISLSELLEHDGDVHEARPLTRVTLARW